MFRWYVINTYSGHENKVKQNLEHRVASLNQSRAVRQVVVPTETGGVADPSVYRLPRLGGLDIRV